MAQRSCLRGSPDTGCGRNYTLVPGARRPTVAAIPARPDSGRLPCRRNNRSVGGVGQSWRHIRLRRERGGFCSYCSPRQAQLVESLPSVRTCIGVRVWVVVALDETSRFRSLYGEYQPEVLAYFLRRLSRDDAVDATAEVSIEEKEICVRFQGLATDTYASLSVDLPAWCQVKKQTWESRLVNSLISYCAGACVRSGTSLLGCALSAKTESYED